MTLSKKRGKAKAPVDPWLDQTVEESVREAIISSLTRKGKSAKVAAVHFLPSTVIKNGNSIEMVANTIVEIAGSRRHRDVFESVVTTRKRSGENQVTHVATHALEREDAHAA